MQSKLLRVLEDRRVRPVGSEREVPVDLRFIFATNAELEREVEQGRFRADLFFRINVMQIHLPPLKDRDNDVQELADPVHAKTVAATRHAARRDRHRRSGPRWHAMTGRATSVNCAT